MGLAPGEPLLGQPDRRGVHRQLHELAPLRPARRPRACFAGRKVAAGVRALVVPGLAAGQEAGGGRGPGPRLPRGGRRVARGRLLDVHRHERRPARARAVRGEHQQPQLRGPPGRRAGARSWPARSPPPPPPSPAASPTPRELLSMMERHPRRSPSRTVVLPIGRRRHRPDHPGPLPEGHEQATAWASACSPTGATTRAGSRGPTSSLNRPGGARARRCWWPGATSAAAPRASTRSWALVDFGFRAVVSTVLRRHLPQQRAQERPAARRGRARRPRALLAAPRARASPSTSRRRRSRCAGRRARAVPRRPFARHCLLEGRRRARLPARRRRRRSPPTSATVQPREQRR